MVVTSQLSARQAATSAGIDAEDRDALDKGSLTFIRDRDEAVPLASLSIGRLSLFCDVLLKLNEISRASECLNAYEARTQSGEGDGSRADAARMIAGKRALIALAEGDAERARSLVENAGDQGSRYVLGLADVQLAIRDKVRAQQLRADAQAIADALALQFNPAPVYYAASLYAALGEPQRAYDLLLEPQRGVVRNYGLMPSRNAFGAAVATAPFRLDIFDEFSFGWFVKYPFAPAANVYVEYLAARCLLELNRYDEARARYDAILAYPSIAAYRDVYWRALYDRAQLALRDGDVAGAVARLKQSADVVEISRGLVASEQGRIGFLDDKQQVYNSLIDLLVKSGAYEDALSYSERSKSRALVDLLAARDRVGTSPEAIALVQELGRREAELAAASSAGAADVDARLDAVKAARARLQQSAPDLAPLVSVSPVGLDVIKSHIRPDEAAVEFVSSQSGWKAFTLNNGKVRVVSLDATGLDEQVRSFNDALVQGSTQSAGELGRALYRELLARALGDVHSKRLTLVPSGILHHLAFAALNDGSHYVIERYALRVVPSLSVLTLPTRHASGTGGLVVGNPSKDDLDEESLPGAEAEAREIASLSPGSGLLIGTAATIGAIRGQAAGHVFFHFAGHGYYDQAKPLNSGLIFAPPRQGENALKVLTASDLYAMRLNVNLAVLSGCSTGVSKFTTGDDVVGLVRGFLYAGPSTVVASLWNVHDDATTELMSAFYSAYLRGMDPSEALRSAQVRIIGEGKYGPSEWAAFFVTSVGK